MSADKVARLWAAAQQAMAAMKQNGGLEGMGDIGKMLQDPEIVAKARQMAQSMGLSGGGMGGGGGVEAELARKRAAQLPQVLGARHAGVERLRQRVGGHLRARRLERLTQPLLGGLIACHRPLVREGGGVRRDSGVGAAAREQRAEGKR